MRCEGWTETRRPSRRLHYRIDGRALCGVRVEPFLLIQLPRGPAPAHACRRCRAIRRARKVQAQQRPS